MEISHLSTSWIPHFDDSNADNECYVDDSDGDRNDGNVGGGDDSGGNGR